MLELLLFSAIPRRDVKPLAKKLIEKFGSFAEVISAPPKRLEGRGLGRATPSIATLKIVEAAAQRLLPRTRTRGQDGALVMERGARLCAAPRRPSPRRSSSASCSSTRRTRLIADEVQQQGTVDHTPVYPREVVKRALELSATAIILVHNHPSGDPTPSQADIEMTRQIASVAKPLGIALHDHIIVGRDGHASLKGLKLI